MASFIYFSPVVPQGQKTLQISILFMCHVWLQPVSQRDTVASAASFVDSRNEMKLELFIFQSVRIHDVHLEHEGWKCSLAQYVNANTYFTLNRVSNRAVCSSVH